MKGHGIIQLMALIALKRAGVPLTRDLVYVGNADEEIGGLGSRTFVEKHPDLVKEHRVRPHRRRRHPGGEREGALVRDRRGREAHLVEEAGGEGHHLARLGAAGRQSGRAAGAGAEPDRRPTRRRCGSRRRWTGSSRRRRRDETGQAKTWLSDAAAALRTKRGRAWLLSEPERNALLRTTITPTVLRGLGEDQHHPAGGLGRARHPAASRRGHRRVPADARAAHRRSRRSSSRRSATWRRPTARRSTPRCSGPSSGWPGGCCPGVPVATPMSAGATDRPYWAAAGLDLLRDRSLAGGAGGEPATRCTATTSGCRWRTSSSG